jgi:hypothetical protein
MNFESKILSNDVEKPKSYLLSNPERFFPTFFSLLSQLFVITKNLTSFDSPF